MRRGERDKLPPSGPLRTTFIKHESSSRGGLSFLYLSITTVARQFVKDSFPSILIDTTVGFHLVASQIHHVATFTDDGVDRMV
jgi:hypothetical protein